MSDSRLVIGFFCHSFVISLCVNKSTRKMPVCECYAFLTYFLLLSSFLSLRSVFSFLATAINFSCGLRPHPHAFCKKRGKNFYVLLLRLFPCALYLSLFIFVFVIYLLSLPRSSHKVLSKSYPYNYQPRENRYLSRFDFRGQDLYRMSPA